MVGDPPSPLDIPNRQSRSSREEAPVSVLDVGAHLGGGPDRNRPGPESSDPSRYNDGRRTELGGTRDSPGSFTKCLGVSVDRIPGLDQCTENHFTFTELWSRGLQGLRTSESVEVSLLNQRAVGQTPFLRLPKKDLERRHVRARVAFRKTFETEWFRRVSDTPGLSGVKNLSGSQCDVQLSAPP